MKLVSWNVNGIRAVTKKNFFQSVNELNADVIGLQETKAQDDQVQEALVDLKGYHIFSNSAVRKGYSGTAILTKEQPIEVEVDIGVEEYDQEGRVIRAEYEAFHLVNVYVPNSGSELARLGYRQEWDKEFLKYLKRLENTKPVILCGDLNVAHRDIDLYHPKPNYNRSAGYMQEEIDGIDNYMNAGFLDTYRHFNPDKVKYSWWSYRANARQNNVGWRIDYFLASQAFLPQLSNPEIHNDIHDSDHCPVSLEVNI